MANPDAIGDSEALVDCGAPASAGGEAAVVRLIAAVVAARPDASVTVDKESRPWFRFGDGRWGRAFYLARV